MLSDIVGTSVLTFNGVAVQLGWVLTVVFILGLFPVSLYTAITMVRTRKMLEESEVLQHGAVQSPSTPLLRKGTCKLGTMGEVAACAFRSPAVGTFVTTAVYGYTLLGQASYLLVLGSSIQMTGYMYEVCMPTAVAIACIILSVPSVVIRQLAESVSLCFFNSLLIVGVIILVLIQAGLREAPCKDTYLFAPGLSTMTLLGASTNVIYSFAGQWMYFELMDTMSNPQDFPKAFAIAGPFMLTTYLAVALLGYGFGAGSSDLVGGMDRSIWLQVAAVGLFVHVLIVYVIKSVVLARYIHALWHPEEVESRSLSSYAGHGGACLAMLLFCFLVSNAIPFFSQLLGLIGGLCAGPISFLGPILFYLAARSQQLAITATPRTEGDDEVTTSTYGSADTSSGTEGIDCDVAASPVRVAPTVGIAALVKALLSLPMWEVSAILFITVFILLTMTIGVADQVKQTIKLWHTLGAPFSCHLLPAPERPVCSL